MLQDVRYALRTLRRAPGFALSAIVALALGIGANTAVFSVVYAVLLRPLPYAEPENIVRLYERNPAQGIERGEVSPGTFVDWRSRARTLDGLAVSTLGTALWSLGDRLETVTFSAVSPALFDVLRVRPLMGRTFRPESQQTSGSDRTRNWSFHTHCGSAPSAAIRTSSGARLRSKRGTRARSLA